MKDTDKPVIFYSYYGGKKRLLRQLYSLKPININTTIEACAGSAVWTINKPKYGKEILNDLSVEIYNLLKLMADKEKGRELVKRLLKIEYSRDAFNKALEAKKNKFENISEMDMAVMSYILLTQSFNATGKSWSEKWPRSLHCRDSGRACDRPGRAHGGGRGHAAGGHGALVRRRRGTRAAVRSVHGGLTQGHRRPGGAHGAAGGLWPEPGAPQQPHHGGYLVLGGIIPVMKTGV